MLTLKQLKEERNHDISELQERISFLESRETQLLAEIEWRDEALKEDTTQKENKQLKEKVQELHDIITAKQEELDVKEQEIINLLGKLHHTSMSQQQDRPQLQDRIQYQNKLEQYRKRLQHHDKTLIGRFSRMKQTTPSMARPFSWSGPAYVPHPFSLNWGLEQKITHKIVRGATAFSNKTKKFYFSCSRSFQIYSYSLLEEKWEKTKPPCPHLFFGMGVVQGCITAVGGQRGPNPISDLISLLEGQEERGWQEMFPPMPTKRMDMAVVVVTQEDRTEHLIAVGGVNEKGVLATVEVLDLQTHEWTSVASLPQPVHLICPALSATHNHLYLLGARHSKAVYSCSIHHLLHSKPHQTEGVWSELPATPTYCPTGVVVEEYLVVVGGFDQEGEDSHAVSYLQKTLDRWVTLSNITTPRNKPLLANLPRGQLMVLGGSTKVNDMMNIVQIADILH